MNEIFKFSVDGNGTVTAIANLWVAGALVTVVILLFWLFPWLRDLFFRDEYEVSEVELGIGNGKVKIKPNHEDLQIAYKLWVELKTRKLGLPFEEDHDVIVEVYDSWYEFFKITRELIKSVPITKIRGQESTQKLVGIAIDVLNKALRPHLTKWQARFRHWYEYELKKSEKTSLPPQDLQKQFPNYKELVSDLKTTNGRLVAYAKLLTNLLGVNPAWRRGT